MSLPDRRAHMCAGRCDLRIVLSLPVCALLMFSLEAEAPKFRLGDATRPTRYRLALTVNPDAATYSGTVLAEIWQNAHDLTIHEAHLTAGGKQLPGRLLTEGKDLSGFAFEHQVEPGVATLRIAFEGKVNDKSSAGLFKMKDGDDWYAFRQICRAG